MPRQQKVKKVSEGTPAPEVKKELTPFDFSNSILKSKKDLIAESEDPVATEKAYNPYMVNMALSQYIDSVMYANDMNGAHWLPHREQYSYLLNSVRSMNRKFAWAKKAAKDEDLDAIVEFYKVNRTRAREYLSVLSPEDVITIRRRLSKGGRVK